MCSSLRTRAVAKSMRPDTHLVPGACDLISSVFCIDCMEAVYLRGKPSSQLELGTAPDDVNSVQTVHWGLAVCT